MSLETSPQSFLPLLASSTSKASSNDHAARLLVRLIQCQQCSYPLRTPVTLPCGYSICRQCLPHSHPRLNISYPDAPGRETGIQCPFPQCAKEHPLSDCSVDVVLLKIMDTISSEVLKYRATAGSNQILLEEVPAIQEPIDHVVSPMHELSNQQQPDPAVHVPRSSSRRAMHKRSIVGGRLLATYLFADSGELHYTSDVRYPPSQDTQDFMDQDLIGALKHVVHEKVECHVCYNMLLEPITTPCGHSFCRKCLARILDHGLCCPHCRRRLSLPSIAISNALRTPSQPNNATLSGLLSSLYPSELQSRREAAELEERSNSDGLDTALFVCTVAYPQMATILHIFEPRYRLMIRRAMEGNRQFGMVAWNQSGSTEAGPLGRTDFYQTGTMLNIEQFETLADGRMFLICKGTYRFKVLAHGMLDGYTIGRVQRHDDVDFAEEERIEASETSQPLPPHLERDHSAQIDRLPTSELLAHGLSFMTRAQSQSAAWLQGNIVQIYGPPPNDPELFPYWFASVVPLQDEKKYRLLPTTTARERLKITLGWIRKIESAAWPIDIFDADDEDFSSDEELTIYYHDPVG